MLVGLRSLLLERGKGCKVLPIATYLEHTTDKYRLGLMEEDMLWLQIPLWARRPQ